MSDADEREQDLNLDESQQGEEQGYAEDSNLDESQQYQQGYDDTGNGYDDSQDQEDGPEESYEGGEGGDTSQGEDPSNQDANLNNSAGTLEPESNNSTSFLGIEQEMAAMKIQAVQRGIRDRTKVKRLKDKGELPAQARAQQSKPKTTRESVKSHGEVNFYEGIGSHYDGELLDGLPHGKGRYTFANGTVYEGEFVAGQFEGKGQFIFEGIGKVEATFVNGRAVDEALTFEDGLQYVPQGWKYCVEGDRRFYHEVVDPRFGLTD